MRPCCWLFLVWICVGASPALACSTFVLHDSQRTLIGHHLDERGYVPGLVVINKRGTRREGIGWNELITGHGGEEVTWTSRFGSVTLNIWGIGYPDGGINERGLYIQEMSLAGSKPPDGPAPALFAPAWIQYVLDNFETVSEAVESTARFRVDGMEWHYLVTDASGDRATIEFIDGEIVVHRSGQMPVPLLCNDAYRTEVSAWRAILQKQREGQAPQELDRFARGANALEATADDVVSLERALRVLESLEQSGTQWTYVLDPNAKNLRYRTKTAPTWRTLDWSAIDFSQGPTLAWNIDEGDPSRWYTPVAPALNHTAANNAVSMFMVLVGPRRLEDYLASVGGSTRMMRAQLSDASRWTDADAAPHASVESANRPRSLNESRAE